jgi:hypothetical protein
MKKYFIILFILLFVSPFTSLAHENIPDGELTKSALKTALYPYILKAIADYQEKTQHYAPFNMNFDLWEAKILNVEKKPNANSFLVKIQLHTYEHAHNPPHFEVTTTIEVSPLGIGVANFEISENKKAQRIEKFYQKAISDITRSFDLNLKSYKVYNSIEVPKGLRDTVRNIIKNILNPEIKPPFKNVIDPVTFLKGNKGYILFKKSDGINVVYNLKKENDTWKIINEKSEQGEKMADELIWYM